jgi:hypothetical protein
MRNFCQKTKIPIDKDEYEKHKRAFQMRKEEKKTYQEIAKITGLNVKNLGFYLNFDPGVPWVLSDWIKDYYQKDSSVYEKVDFIVDPDSKVVERFQKRGIGGRILQSL